MAEPLAVGDVVTVLLPERTPQGHEQEGRRPAAVVGLPDRLGPARSSVLVIVPFSRYQSQPWADAAPERYPRFEAGTARLHSPSIALLDQILSVDVRRVERRRGRLTAAQYGPIKRAFAKMADLGSW
ncbi:MAG: type II toxin-antitoxin system PemK/MazF family toxin [Trueperaceae bacterium]